MFSKLHFLILLSSVSLTLGWWWVCDDDNCEDCVSGRGSCRWCKRSNRCHMLGSLVNPCKRAENIVDKLHCSNELSHYIPDLSFKMLLLSSVAYDPAHPQECLNNSLSSSNFILKTNVTKDCDMFDNKCSGYVAVSDVDKAIVVAFRGSNNFDQAFVLFLEVLTSPKDSFLGGEVQSYWKRAFKLLWPDMEAEVRSLVSKHPSYHVWVTGHSLGGALASLASTWIAYYNIASRKNIILYTFGMPRVGDYDYALQHDQLVNISWRVVNYDDPVPHFPTFISVSIFNGPYHHGIEAFYTEPAVSVYSRHKECHGKPYNEDARCSFSVVGRSFERHIYYFGIPVGEFWKSKCVR